MNKFDFLSFQILRIFQKNADVIGDQFAKIDRPGFLGIFTAWAGTIKLIAAVIY